MRHNARAPFLETVYVDRHSQHFKFHKVVRKQI